MSATSTAAIATSATSMLSAVSTISEPQQPPSEQPPKLYLYEQQVDPSLEAATIPHTIFCIIDNSGSMKFSGLEFAYSVLADALVTKDADIAARPVVAVTFSDEQNTSIVDFPTYLPEGIGRETKLARGIQHLRHSKSLEQVPDNSTITIIFLSDGIVDDIAAARDELVQLQELIQAKKLHCDVITCSVGTKGDENFRSIFESFGRGSAIDILANLPDDGNAIYTNMLAAALKYPAMTKPEATVTLVKAVRLDPKTGVIQSRYWVEPHIVDGSVDGGSGSSVVSTPTTNIQRQEVTTLEQLKDAATYLAMYYRRSKDRGDLESRERAKQLEVGIRHLMNTIPEAKNDVMLQQLITNKVYKTSVGSTYACSRTYCGDGASAAFITSTSMPSAPRQHRHQQQHHHHAAQPLIPRPPVRVYHPHGSNEPTLPLPLPQQPTTQQTQQPDQEQARINALVSESLLLEEQAHRLAAEKARVQRELYELRLCRS